MLSSVLLLAEGQLFLCMVFIWDSRLGRGKKATSLSSSCGEEALSSLARAVLQGYKHCKAEERWSLEGSLSLQIRAQCSVSLNLGLFNGI